MKIALIGATGIVGMECLRLIQEKGWEVTCFASSAKKGCEKLCSTSFDAIDLALFCTGSEVSKKWVPVALKAGTKVIDASSYFRMSAPLIIPEINLNACTGDLIASPNCVATLLCMALFSLHKTFNLERVVVSTYQAASGAGAKGVQELKNATKCALEGLDFNPHQFPVSYGFNIFPHNTPLDADGYCEEEKKVMEETRKILRLQTLPIAVRAIRVPTLRAHGLAINASFQKKVDINIALEKLKRTEGISVVENATPHLASGQSEIFISHVRKDLSQENGLDLWVVGDQLLKGAALNMIQIAEKRFLNYNFCHA